MSVTTLLGAREKAIIFMRYIRKAIDSSASREPSASPVTFADAFTFFSGPFGFLISAESPHGEPARQSRRHGEVHALNVK